MFLIYSVQFSSVQSLSRFRLFATPWIIAHQASLSITNSQSSLRFASIESVMPSSHLILCHPLLLLPPIPPSTKVFSSESTLHMRWPKYSMSILVYKFLLSLDKFLIVKLLNQGKTSILKLLSQIIKVLYWSGLLVTQSCPTLCDPMDCSLPGSSVYGILQARILAWVAISFSRGSSGPRYWTWVSCIAGRFFAV